MSDSMENAYEQEMIRLAEEISLLDEYQLTWDPSNLNDTKDRVKIYEEIVDGHLGLHDGILQDNRSGSPISDLQIREIFGYPVESHVTTEERISTTSLSSFSQPNSDIGGIETQLNPHHRRLDRRPTTRGREQMIKETVHSICRSLRWYQNKIVRQIESSKEVRLCYFSMFGLVWW